MSRIVIYNIREELTLKQRVSSSIFKLAEMVCSRTFDISGMFGSYRFKASLMGLVCIMLVSSSCGMEASQYSNIRPEAGHMMDRTALAATADLMKLIKKDPEYILQAKARDIQEIFKTPRLSRVDNPSLIWHYKSEQCIMDVYFSTQDDQENPSLLPVRYVEFRDSLGQNLDLVQQESCVKGLIANPYASRMPLQNSRLS